MKNRFCMGLIVAGSVLFGTLGHAQAEHANKVEEIVIVIRTHFDIGHTDSIYCAPLRSDKIHK
jgi:hypothetical protein